MRYHNGQVSFVSGIITLTIGIVVTYGLGLIWNKVRK